MGLRSYRYHRAEVIRDGASRVFRAPGPFSIGILKIEGVMCSDGVRRTAHCTAPADTFFSQPACVRLRGKTVSGCISRNNVDGWYFWRFAHGHNAVQLPAFPCQWCFGSGMMRGFGEEARPCFDCAKKEEH